MEFKQIPELDNNVGQQHWKGLAKTDTMNLVFLQKYGDRNVWSPKALIHA